MGRGPWLLGAGVVLVSLQLSREGCPQLVSPALGLSGKRSPCPHRALCITPQENCKDPGWEDRSANALT